MIPNRKQEIKQYMTMLSILSLVAFLLNFQPMVRSYNTTMLSLSYEYGFTSRSLLGTIYHILDKIIPVDMMNYHAATVFATVVTILFIGFLLFAAFGFLWYCSDDSVKLVEYLSMIVLLNVITTYSYPYNLLRVDIFMIGVSLVGVLALVSGRAEWLVIPLSALGVMFHQGYVFMYFNLILVLLFYQMLTVEGKRAKYAIYFGVSLALGSVLFLWFELFSRTNGDAIFDKVVSEATALSFDGIYHSTLLYHEVLGIDLAASETELMMINRVHFPIFIILILPYIILFGRLFINVIKQVDTKLLKFKYIIVAIGSATMLPDFLMKVDYGRWVVSVIVYYFVIVLALIAMGDAYIKNEAIKIGAECKSKLWFIILIIYPVLLYPFLDVDIDAFLRHFAGLINDTFLHWY